MLNLWSSPIRIIVAVVLLYEEVGVASFVAVGLLVIMMPVQKKLVSMSSALLKKSLGSTDERVKLVGEVLGAMDVVKCYAWEVREGLFILNAIDSNLTRILILVKFDETCRRDA